MAVTIGKITDQWSIFQHATFDCRMGMRKLSYVAYELHPSPVETAETAHGCSEPGVKTVDLQYPVVRRERFGARGTHIPYIFLIQWGAKELLGVSQPSSSVS